MFLSVSLLLNSCKKKSIYNHNTSLLGTIVNLTLITDSEKRANRSAELVFNEIGRLEKIMSPFRQESDVYRINNLAMKRPVIVSEETFSLLETSIETSTRTNGCFDITFASISHLWNFRRNPFVPPRRDEVLKLLPMLDYRHIQLNPDNLSVKINNRKTRIGLGGIAKGYAINKGIECLRRIGIDCAIVEAGGDLQVIGKKFNNPWRVGVRNPREKNIILSLTLDDMESIATSGDYERYVIYKDKRYHHIIDPKTGFPSKTFSSVSVISIDPVQSDALATALFIMGGRKAMQFVKHDKNISAVFIDLDMNISASEELKDRVILLGNKVIEWF
ncbi:MAG: FAD:protein FMN transferase [Spirochaetota bacterium]|nr:FAD:protein FMN transferase [Spirochaetota bacterium]